MLRYSLDWKVANRLFVKQRQVYGVGVTVKSQIRLLQYWQHLLNTPLELSVFSQVSNSQTEWVLKTCQLVDTTGKSKKKHFNLKFCQYDLHHLTGQHPRYIKGIEANQIVHSNVPISQDFFVEIEYTNIVTKLYATFGINVLLEKLAHKTDLVRSIQCQITWKEMDGFRGTPFKGRNYFDAVVLTIDNFA